MKSIVRRETHIYPRELLRVIIFASFYALVQTQSCPVDGIAAGVEAMSRSFAAASGQRYVMKGKGTITCSGVIKEWIFYSNSRCSMAMYRTDFEVWRSDAPPSVVHRLVGKNSFTEFDCPDRNANLMTLRVSPVERIPVEAGYLIGWNQWNLALPINYDAVTDSASVYWSFASSSIDVGSTDNLTGSNSTDLRDFSLKVTIIQGEYPTLDNLPAAVSIEENIPSPSPVLFSAVASHVSNNKYSDAVQFNFTCSQNMPFRISSSAGGVATITTNPGAVIDYEQQSVYQFEITVKGLGLSTTKILTINIIDINEPHILANLPSIVTVFASTTVADEEIFRVLVNDPDKNPPIPLKFYILGWSSPNTTADVPPVTLDPATGFVTTSVDLRGWNLLFPTQPSYLSYVIYDLDVQATDGTFSDIQKLTINITNINGPPIILNLPANITIQDSLPVNASIYQVLVAPNSDPILRFKITSRATPFCINEKSGLIVICGPTDLTPSYAVNITVTNSALSQWSLLTVVIECVNIAPGFSHHTYSGLIEENCSSTGGLCISPVTVTTVTVNDPNCIPPDSRKCSISPGDGSQFFDIKNCSTVLNIMSIDIDLSSDYENILLLIKVFDSGNFTDYAFVNVSVIDINDNAPTFSQSVYNGSVTDDAVGGTSVLTVSASDLDRGINGEICFSISATDPSFLYLQVHRQSGLVTTKQPLDIENSTITVTVWATDNGYPISRSSSATVVLTVVGVNNNRRPWIVCSNRPSDEPYLPPPHPCFYNYDLKSNAAKGSKVSDLLLTADDIDPQPCLIEFHQLAADDHFTLNESNGLIKVARKIDAYKKYLLYVYAEDNGHPSLKSRVMYIRIDTYHPERHWIDLTVRPKNSTFNKNTFLAALRNVTSPWFMKIVSVTNYEPNVQKDIKVTVYALADTTTYLPDNIANKKDFVSQEDLLKKLRKNKYGDPGSILRGPVFEDNFPVIKVMPSYINWWTDTIEGIATIVCLSVIPVIVATGVAVAICKAYKLLCFKSKASKNPAIISNSGATKTDPPDSSNKEIVRHRSAHARRESIDTNRIAVAEKE